MVSLFPRGNGVQIDPTEFILILQLRKTYQLDAEPSEGVHNIP